MEKKKKSKGAPLGQERTIREKGQSSKSEDVPGEAGD